jgi:hypothetical protein
VTTAFAEDAPRAAKATAPERYDLPDPVALAAAANAALTVIWPPLTLVGAAALNGAARTSHELFPEYPGA